MPTDFVPTKDAALLAFALNMSTLITASPATYGLDTTYAVALASDYSTFNAAMALTNNPATKTKVTVASKDAAKASLKGFIRTCAAVTQTDPSVTNANKTALGLTIKNTSPAPVPAPSTYPILSVAGSGSLAQTVKFADSGTPSSKRKPTGATGLVLFCSTSAVPITDPTQLAFRVVGTKNPTPVSFVASDASKVAYYAGRWITRKGLLGPWSSIYTLGVAA
jgi:hypothetical protein